MDKFEFPTILHCEAMKAGENQQTRYDILVALKTLDGSKNDFEINNHLHQMGYEFLYSDAGVSANHYLENTSEHHSTVLELCRQLSQEHPIASKAVGILHSDDTELTALEYISIEILSTPKEIPCKEIPFWEREWINPALKETLFIAHKTSDSSSPVRTYLIVDATLYIEHRGVFDIDLIDDCPVLCMFTGEAAETLKMAAPYLIDITLSEEAYNDDSKVSYFHKRFFETMWGNNVGIFIQSTAPMEAIHQHYRKFLKFNLECANNRFFRYWDPRVLKVHLPTLATYTKTSHKFFSVPSASYNEPFPAVTFIYEDHSDLIIDEPNVLKAEEAIPEFQPINTKIAHFNQQAFDQAQQAIALLGPEINAAKEPPLYQITTEGFTAHKIQSFCDKTALWLIENYSEKTFEGMSISQFLLKQVPILENNYEIDSDYAMQNALEGCYLLETGIKEMADSYLQLLAQQDISPMQRSDNFSNAIFEAVKGGA